MAIVISTYILINVLEKSSENAERKIVCTLCYRTFPTHDWTLDFSTMNFSILWGWKVWGWNVLTLVAFNFRLFNPEFWKVSDWKKAGDEKPKEEKSGVEISRVEIYGGEMSCNHRTHNPADMTNHFHLKSQVESEWSRTTQWGQHIYRVLFTDDKILSSTYKFI